MNTTNALRVLRLPEYLNMFDGLVYEEFRRSAYIERTNDFTRMVKNPITGKSEPTITEKLMFSEKTISMAPMSKIYALNWIDFRFTKTFAQIEQDLSGATVAKLQYDVQERVLELGPRAGETVWYNGLSVEFIDFSPTEKHVVVRTTPGINTVIVNGVATSTDKNNPLVPIPRVDKIITGLVRTSRTGERTVTNLKERTISGGTPNVLLSKLLEMGGFSTSQEYMAANYSIFKIEPQPTPNHIVNTSIEAVFTPSGNDLIADAIVYYNGVSTDEKRPSGMITSYNKAYPGHVVRWRLYDGVVNDSIYGSSATVTFSSQADDKIKIVAGNVSSYDSTTKTLTYNVEDDATLWVTFEELPAQGKNWGNEAMYLLSNGATPIRTW